MNTAGKVVIGLLVVGGIGAAVLLSSPSTAHASTKPPLPPPPVPPTPGPPLVPQGQPQDHDPQAGGVVVAPPSSAPPGTPIGVIPPPAGGVPTPTPGGGISLPLPGGGAVTVPAGTLPQVTQTPGGGTVLTLPGGGQLPLPAAPGLPATPAPAGTVQLPPLVVTSSGEPTAPADTIAVAQAMLQAEGPNTIWRSTAIPGLADWQRARGLTADGSAGTKTMLRMAQEIGAIPIVRAWPKDSYREGHWLGDYKASLQQIANSKTGQHADLLRQSAAREDGQGFGTPPKPILTLLTLEG